MSVFKLPLSIYQSISHHIPCRNPFISSLSTTNLFVCTLSIYPLPPGSHAPINLPIIYHASILPLLPLFVHSPFMCPLIFHPSIHPSIHNLLIYLSVHYSSICSPYSPQLPISLPIHPLTFLFHTSICLFIVHPSMYLLIYPLYFLSNFQLCINPPIRFHLHPYSMHHPFIINSPSTRHPFIHFSIHWPTHLFPSNHSFIHLLFCPSTVICVSCCTEPQSRW